MARLKDFDEIMEREVLNEGVALRLRQHVAQNFPVQADAARALGISWQRLQNYLSGRRSIDAYMVTLIHLRLRVSLYWLLGIEVIVKPTRRKKR